MLGPGAVVRTHLDPQSISQHLVPRHTQPWTLTAPCPQTHTALDPHSTMCSGKGLWLVPGTWTLTPACPLTHTHPWTLTPACPLTHTHPWTLTAPCPLTQHSLGPSTSTPPCAETRTWYLDPQSTLTPDTQHSLGPSQQLVLRPGAVARTWSPRAPCPPTHTALDSHTPCPLTQHSLGP